MGIVVLGAGGVIKEDPSASEVNPEHSLQQAHANLLVFVEDLKAEHQLDLDGEIEIPEGCVDPMLMGGTKYQDEHDGRYPFYITVGGERHLIEVPGIPIEQVRYVYAEGQNIWDFPRLFIDGSSWVWPYALNVVCPDDGEKRPQAFAAAQAASHKALGF